MPSDREDLRQRVNELEATVRGLTQELVEADDRIRTLEREAEESASDGPVSDEGGESSSDRPMADKGEESSEETENATEEQEEEEDDIIIA